MNMKGRALIDLPAHGLSCGEFGDIEDAAAKALAEAGSFDVKASVDGQEQKEQAGPKSPPRVRRRGA